VGYLTRGIVVLALTGASLSVVAFRANTDRGVGSMIWQPHGNRDIGSAATDHQNGKAFR
jgi:hypothetical protein